MFQPPSFGWFAISVCMLLFARKCRTDVRTMEAYKTVSTVMTHVKEIDQKLRSRIFLPHIFGELKYRVRVQKSLGYICVVDSSSLHLIDNYVCMMQAHDTIHQVVFITLDSTADNYLLENYPLLLRNFVDLKKQVIDLPISNLEKKLVTEHLKRIVILQTVSMFTIRNFDLLVTNPYIFWTKNISTVTLTSSSRPSTQQLEEKVFFGQMGNDEMPISRNVDQMFGETFIVMGKQELGRWFAKMIDRIACTFSSLQGTISYHCEDPRAQCGLLENEFFSTTDWFYGSRENVPFIIEMDRPEYRTPRAINRIGANFLTPDGKCNSTRVWEFGSQLGSAPPFNRPIHMIDRYFLAPPTHNRVFFGAPF